MSKQFYTLFFLLLISFSNANATDFFRFRSLIGASLDNKDSAKILFSLTEKFNEKSAAIDVAFKGMASLMMCNHLGNPLSKLSYFNNGKALIEKAIEKEINNTEIRFMRFCTQTNTPKFLNYYGNINEDKKALITYLQKQKNETTRDNYLFANIKANLLDSKSCSDTEKKTIKNL